MNTPLKEIRKKLGKKLIDVSHAVGTDTGNLSRIENGKQKASLDLAERIATHYENKITELQILYPERYLKKEKSPVPRKQKAAA